MDAKDPFVIHVHAWDDSRVALDQLEHLCRDLAQRMAIEMRFHQFHIDRPVDPLAELLALAVTGDPHLVLCDLEMPTDSMVVLEQYRATYPECRRVLLTSRDRPRSDTRIADRPGLVDTALKKPADETHLRAVLRLCVLRHERW